MNEWLKCSACKRGIGFSVTHWVCSVSTCNRNRTRLVFCSVSCWDSHVAMLRHREAWAVEATSPTVAAWQAELASAEPAVPAAASAPAARLATPDSPSSAPAQRSGTPDSPSGGPVRAAALGTTPTATSTPDVRRQVITTASPAASVGGPALSTTFDRDVLIVVSKMKKYIKDRSGMNCSDGVADMLSEHVRALCDDAIRVAGQDGRKTVLDRDVVRPRPR